jgi:putative nucleotidyltransferase with HDIG domain
MLKSSIPKSSILKSSIPEEVMHLLAMLEGDGHKAFIVGGAVRDEMMGIEPKDYDIATSAMPDEIIQTFASADYALKDIDAASYHIVQVNGYEVATFRRDIYENGETVGTVPVDSIEADLARRDLTINAMAISRHGELIDPYNGRSDLVTGTIRFVNDPTDRILEDPCRIIRAARFAALIDGYFSPMTLDALKQNISLVQEVPSERIRAEILKTMRYNKASMFFKSLHMIGALEKILPSLNMLWGLNGGPYHGESVFTHSMMTGDFVGITFSERSLANPMFRLIAYLHDVGKSVPNYVDGVIHFYHHPEIGAEMVEKDLRHLKFTNNEIKYATNLIGVHMRGGTKMSPKTTRKLLKKFTETNVDWEDWLALKVADRASNTAREPYSSKQVIKLRRKFEHELNPQPRDISGLARTAFEHKDLAISGTRIQELLHIGPSQLIGVILNWLLDMVINNPSLNTPEQLEKLLIGSKK